MNTFRTSQCFRLTGAACRTRIAPPTAFRTNVFQNSTRFFATENSGKLTPTSRMGGNKMATSEIGVARRRISTQPEMGSSKAPKDSEKGHSHSHNGVPCDHSHSHGGWTGSNYLDQGGQSGASSGGRNESNAIGDTADCGHSHSVTDLSHDSGHSHSHSDGHSHGLFHSHSHGPNELLTLGSFSNPAVRITWVGLLVNVGMAASKGVGGVYFHSQALIADAIHAVLDMVADFLTLATVNVASKPGMPTRFPLGYGKIETVGSVLVSGILLFAGVSVGWSSLLLIFEYTLPAYLYEYVSMVQIGHSHSHFGGGAVLDGHSHSHGDVGHSHSDALLDAGASLVAQPTQKQIPNINAAWLAGGSIIVKEFLYRKTMAVAEKTNSKVLVANAWHHRVDSLTAFVALLTVAGSHLFNVVWLDSVGGLCVSILIIRAGWSSFVTSCSELVDRGEPQTSEVYATIESAIQDEISIALDPFSVSSPMGLTLKKLSVVTLGANTNIYITIATSSNDLSIAKLNEFESRLVTAVKRDDKFVKNVFVMFKSPSVKG